MILLRHGEGSWNCHFHDCRIDAAIHDPGLTDRGREQVAAAAERLSGEGLARLVASPYRRTLETATIIAGRLGLDIEVDPLVRERCAFSCDQGTPVSVLEQEWPGIDFAGLDEVWWGRRIESQSSIDGRVRAFAWRMTQAAAWRTTVVVSHWGFIRAATGRAIGNAEHVRFIPAPERLQAEGSDDDE